MATIRRTRLQITLSVPMRLSLEVLAARTGLPVTTQATMILRQALDRTIASAEVQRRLGAHNRQRKQAEWLEERSVEHAVETEYAHLAQAGGRVTRSRDALVPERLESNNEGPAYGIPLEQERTEE